MGCAVAGWRRCSWLCAGWRWPRGAAAAAESPRCGWSAPTTACYLSAAVRFELPPLVEDALDKGIAMYLRGRGRAATATAGTGTTSKVAQVSAPHAPGLPAAHAPLAAERLAGARSATRASASRWTRTSTRREEALDAVQRMAGCALGDRRGRRRSSRRRYNVDLPLPARRLAAAAAVPDRRGRPGRLEHLGRAQRCACRWRSAR